ncbi:hypothetical protein H4R35_006516 [Dimargaris xerosporica]|nr:hypothetical protein H4R35_006516 [Dimargaris xerosporica]
MYCAPVWVWAGVWGLANAASLMAAGTLPDDALGTPPVLAMAAYRFHVATTDSDPPSFLQQSTLSRIAPDTPTTNLDTPDGIQGVLHDNWFPRFGDVPDYAWLIYLRCTDATASEKLRLALTTNVSAAVIQRPGDAPCPANIEAELTKQGQTLPMFWSTESPGVFDLLATNSTASISYPVYVFVAIWDTVQQDQVPPLHLPAAQTLDQDHNVFVGTSFLIYAACGVVGTLIIGLIGYLGRRCWIHRHAHEQQLAGHPALVYTGEPFLSPSKPGIDPNILAAFPLRQYGALEKSSHPPSNGHSGQGSLSPTPPPLHIRCKSDVGSSGPRRLGATSVLTGSLPPPRSQGAVDYLDLAELVNRSSKRAIVPGMAGSPTDHAWQHRHDADASPAALTELCAICLSDFCAGDNVRVLPCHHQYHPLCIDPWLLNVSSLCPLCKANVLAAPCASAALASPTAMDTSPLSTRGPVPWPLGAIGIDGSLPLPPRRHSLYHTYQTHSTGTGPNSPESTQLARGRSVHQAVVLRFLRRVRQPPYRFWRRRSVGPMMFSAADEAG